MKSNLSRELLNLKANWRLSRSLNPPYMKLLHRYMKVNKLLSLMLKTLKIQQPNKQQLILRKKMDLAHLNKCVKLIMGRK
jgi:hypothetical protein